MSTNLISPVEKTGSADYTLKLTDLSYSMKQKYAYSSGIYKYETDILKFLTQLESKGENSWKRLNEKIDIINQADYKTQHYHDAIYDAIEVNKIYSPDDIITIIANVRRDVGLAPYISSLKRNCEKDFNLLFTVRTITEEFEVDNVMKKRIVGYKPTFKLKPEE